MQERTTSGLNHQRHWLISLADDSNTCTVVEYLAWVKEQEKARHWRLWNIPRLDDVMVGTLFTTRLVICKLVREKLNKSDHFKGSKFVNCHCICYPTWVSCSNYWSSCHNPFATIMFSMSPNKCECKSLSFLWHSSNEERRTTRQRFSLSPGKFLASDVILSMYLDCQEKVSQSQSAVKAGQLTNLCFFPL